MSEWKEYKIEELGEVVTGKTPSRKNPEDFGDVMPFVTPTDYKYFNKWAEYSERKLSATGIEKLRSKVLPPKSAMVTCIGSDMGKVALNKVPVITNQQINSVVPNDDIVDPDFLYYSLLSEYDTLRMLGQSGTAVPILNKGDFEDVVLSIPPLPEQRAIASVLSSLDDKIDLLHRQNKTLEALAETLFRQWFVEEAERKILLGEIAEVATGKGLKREEFVDEGGYPVLGANGEIGRARNYLTDDRLILTGRVGTLGKVYISEGRVWISDNVLIVRPIADKYFYPIYFGFKSLDFENLNVGSTQPLVTQTDLKNIEVTLPNDETLKDYFSHCKGYFDKISKNQVHIRALTQMRDTLLPKLMSREVRVRV
jgi:type I restriction enzyme S subunit